MKRILLHCLDHNFSGRFKLFGEFRVLGHLFTFSIYSALGFGAHFSHLADQLKNFVSPARACGWDCNGILRHCHVVVQKPTGGMYSTVNVALPHVTHLDHFKRVSL